VRALGAHIKGTNGKSQGVVPFLKVVNDTAVAVNQGGKRKGAVCAYLEAGTSTSRNSSNCARTPATTAAARTT
jgi:ribonucleotide reductase alpha subunit